MTTKGCFNIWDTFFFGFFGGGGGVDLIECNFLVSAYISWENYKYVEKSVTPCEINVGYALMLSTLELQQAEIS